MSLELLHRRLAEVARKRVHSGELTERGLARLCGVSQPHMHNVLKGIRSLSTGSADRLIGSLKLTLAELVWETSGEGDGSVRPVPLLRNRIGPGTNAALSQIGGDVPFPASLIARLVEPLAARIGPDLGLPRQLAANDLVLLDQNSSLRARPAAGACWLVRESNGLRLRYAKVDGGRLLIGNESSAGDPQLWRSVSISEGEFLDIVLARVVWLGRELPAG